MKMLARVLGGILMLIVGLAILGAVYEAVASTQDSVRYPPPGRLVDVGGYRVHLLCMGQGSPTVLLDASSGGWTTTEWEPVQPAVARTTRVCAWDRAGSGWSDTGPPQHTPSGYAAEMAAVLRAAEIEGPYVLVAASYGGRVARLYASEHADQVLGMVLVDAVHEDAYTERDLARREEQLRYLTVGNWILLRLGVARLLGPELVPFINGPVGYALPEATRELVAVVSSRPKNQEGNARLHASHQADDGRLRSAGPLGDVPLVVLSSADRVRLSESWDIGQAKLAALSTRSVRVVASGNHLIAWEHPDLVVSAIRCVLDAASDPVGGPLTSYPTGPCRDTRDLAPAS